MFKSNYLLWILAIIALVIPIFSQQHLISLDGPCHFYNAKIFSELYLSDNSFYAEYFKWNDEFTPNLGGIVITGLLMKIMAPWAAVKVFYLIYITGMMLSIRYLLKSYVKEIRPHHLVLFLIIYNIFWEFGFVNFQMAFIPMIFLVGYHERYGLDTWTNFLISAVLFVITYALHSIVFGFGAIIIGSKILYKFKNDKNLKAFIKQGFLLTLAGAIPLVSTLLFLGNREAHSEYLDAPKLLNRWFHIDSFNYFNVYQGVLGFSMMALLYVSFIYTLRKRGRNKKPHFNHWYFTALIVMVLYLVLPDSVGYAQVFSFRIEYLLWISIITFIALSTVNKVSSKIIGFITVIILFSAAEKHTDSISGLNYDVKQVLQATEHINNESVVYPMFCSNTWNHKHFSNYLGLEKSLLILENSSARQDYFPLVYKHPLEAAETYIRDGKLYYNEDSLEINYIIKIGNLLPEYEKDIAAYQSAIEYGKLIFSNDLVSLYKLD